MKSKQAALLKDLARLLTKYDTRDWEPFIRLFTAKPSVLVNAISAAQGQMPAVTPSKAARTKPSRPAKSSKPSKSSRLQKAKASTTSKKPRSVPIKSRKPSRTPAKRTTAQDFKEFPLYYRVLDKAPLSDLQTLYVEAVGDKRVPKSRSELIAALSTHLGGLNDYERAPLLVYLSRGDADSTETFRRWSEIISKPRSNK